MLAELAEIAALMQVAIVCLTDLRRDEKAAEGYFVAHSNRLPDGALHVVSLDPGREAVVEGDPGLRPSTCSGPV